MSRKLMCALALFVSLGSVGCIHFTSPFVKPPQDPIPPDPAPPVVQARYEPAQIQAAQYSRDLAALRNEYDLILNKVRALESMLAQRDRTLQYSIDSAQKAATAVSDIRKEMEFFRQDINRSNAQLKLAQEEHLLTLQSMIKIVDRMNKQKEQGQ